MKAGDKLQASPTQRRPRILFAWEMGGNYGHIDKIITLERALQGRADIYAVVQNPISLRRLAPDMRATVLAAPYTTVSALADAEGNPVSYADALRRCGWHDSEALATLIEAWQSLYDLIEPDVIVAQSAPTALLAARGSPWGTVLLGYGYDAPPRCTPMPPLRWWQEEDQARAEHIENHVLETVNTALRRRAQPALARLSDFMAVDRYLLASFPELDHYGDRSRWEPDHAPYLGQLCETSMGEVIEWRGAAPSRVFLYIRPQSRVFKVVLEVFSRPSPDWDVVFAAPGISHEDAAALRAAGVQIVNGPVRLDRLLADCSLGIHHASNGTASALLMAGIPQLGLPGHREQLMCARALTEAGLGAGIGGRFGSETLRTMIEKILREPRFRDNALRAGERIQATYRGNLAKDIADMLLTLATRRSNGKKERA